MGTEKLVFVFFLIIFQVVTAVPSGFPERFQLEPQLVSVNEYPPDAAFRNYNPIQGQNYISLDDVSETQLPRPPTQNESPTQINVLSGAGNIETNDIVKKPSVQPNLDSSSITMQKNGQPQTSNNSPTNNKFNYPELDQAVENAVNSLPSGSEYPLVPLIKVYNQRIDEHLKNGDMNSEDFARKRIFQKNIVLKLANKVQKLMEENNTQAANENLIKMTPQAQNQMEKPTAVDAVNDKNDNDCDCDGGCIEVPAQNQPEADMIGCDEEPMKQHLEPKPEKKKKFVISNLAQIEDKNDSSSVDPSKDGLKEEGCMSGDGDKNAEDSPAFLLMLKVLNMEYENPMENLPQRPREVSNPTFMFRLSKNSVSLNSIPKSSLNTNEGVPNGEAFLSGLIPGGYGGNDNENENDRESGETFVRLMTNDNLDEGDDYQPPIVNIVPGNQKPSFQDINRQQTPQNNSKGLVLLKILTDVMKQKAAAEAFKVMQENQMQSLPSAGEIQNKPLAGSRIVILTKGNDHGSLLPPLRFPYDSSATKIHFIPTETKQDHSESNVNADLSSKTSDAVKNVSSAQEMITPQEMPWFIRHIIMSLNQQHRDLKPSSTLTTPSQNNVENNPVPLRALLAPFTI